jgi:septal ring factor EnvC (AmiA/AmiB activator)
LSASQSRTTDLETQLKDSVQKLDTTASQLQGEKAALEKQLSAKQADYESLVTEKDGYARHIAEAEETLKSVRENGTAHEAKVVSLTEEVCLKAI